MESVRVRVPAHVLVRSVKGELVLLNLDNEHLYGLDATGTMMWEAVTATPTIEDALEELSSRFDIDRQTLSDDLGKLLHELSGYGLVELDPA